MADQQKPAAYRFAPYVSPTAPKIGHQLATASFQLGREMIVLSVVEGSRNDTVSLLGMATDFERSRVVSFSLHGPLLERLNQLPPSPYDRGLTLRFTGLADEPLPIPVTNAVAVYSGLRSAERPDPDSAAAAYRLSGDGGEGRVLAAITGYQRGWLFIVVLVAVGLAIWVESIRPIAVDGTEALLGVEEERPGPGGLLLAGGAVTYRASVIDV